MPSNTTQSLCKIELFLYMYSTCFSGRHQACQYKNYIRENIYTYVSWNQLKVLMSSVPLLVDMGTACCGECTHSMVHQVLYIRYGVRTFQFKPCGLTGAR